VIILKYKKYFCVFSTFFLLLLFFSSEIFAVNLIPSLNKNIPPKTVSIKPQSGSSRPNVSISFTGTYYDQNGWKDIQTAGFLVNSNSGFSNSFLSSLKPNPLFSAIYNQNTNKLYVYDVKMNTIIGGYSPGAAKVIESAYGKLYCNKTVVSIKDSKTLEIKWEVSFKVGLEGNQNVYISVKDDANSDTGWKQMGTWTVDSVLPNGSIKINNNVPYTNSSNVMLQLSANDNLGSILQMKFSNDNINWSADEAYANSKNWTLSNGDGKKTVYVKYKDSAGNWSNSISGQIILDTTLPQVQITLPLQNTAINQNQINVSGIFNDASIDNIRVNGIISIIQGNNFLVQNIVLSREGTNSIQAVATDKAGNVSSTTISIIRDTQVPQIIVVSPLNNAVVNSDTIKVFGTVNENNTVITINGNTAISGNNQFMLSDIPIKQGQNTITINTIDQAGNVTSQSITIIGKNSPNPEFLIDDFANTQAAKNTLSFWTGDNQSCAENVDQAGVHKIRWTNNSSYWFTNLWDEVSVSQGTDISCYERLTFKIRGETGGENFSIELQDIAHGINFNKKVEISAYASITNQWQEVSIPLKDFVVNGVWKTHARSLIFNFNKTISGTIYIDDVKLKSCVVDSFYDAIPNLNNLGYVSSDNGTLQENLDENGYHKYTWNNVNAEWYTTLYDGVNDTDFSKYSYLILRVRGAIGNENFTVELQNAQGTAFREINQYGTITTDWQCFYLPLADFAINKSTLRKLTLKFNKIPSGTVFIDKIAISDTNGKAFIKPVSTCPVKFINNQLIVNGAPFLIRGVSYQPTPVGELPVIGNSLFQDPQIYTRDLPILRALGCNTIRTWKKINNHDFLTACYNNNIEPIYVIMGFPIEYNDLNNEQTRNLIKQEFSEYVMEYKNDPAAFMWALGNEVNMTYQGNITDWYSLANELAEIAYEIEGQNYHPVIIVNKDIDQIGKQSYNSTDTSLNYIDAWGINVYRGISFKGFFTSYSQTSAKPLVVTEFGADAWRSGIVSPLLGKEDPAMQAEYNYNNWIEIKQAVGCAGGTIMEYCDEWWKVIGKNIEDHDLGGFQFRYDQPDNFANEEYWGLCKVVDNGNSPDIIIPRKSYAVMKLAFANETYSKTALAWEFNNNGNLEGWTSGGGLSNLTVSNGTLNANISAQNPILISPANLTINGLLYSGIAMSLKISSGMQISVQWKKEEDPAFLSENAQSFFITGDNNFHDYLFYLGDNINWNGNIIQFKITPYVPVNGKIEIDYIRIVQGQLPQDFIAPENITNLSAIPGNHKVTLNWTKSVNTQKDILNQMLYINSGNGWGNAIALGQNISTYEAENLINGIIYNFKITCIDSSLNENEGIVVQSTPVDTNPPENITALSAVPGNTNVVLSWTASINSEGDLANYKLYIDSGAGFGQAQILSLNPTTFTVNGLTNGQLYRFKIASLDTSNNESTGVIVQAIPQASGAPVIKITSPIQNTITKILTINVSGTINNNQAIITINNIPAIINSGTFTANNVPLNNEEANKIIATATLNGKIGKDQITVYRDTIPPEIEITYPVNGEIVEGHP